MRILLKGNMDGKSFSQAHIDMLRRYIRPTDELLLKSGEGGILDFIWKTVDVIIAVNEGISVKDVQLAPQLGMVFVFEERFTGKVDGLLAERKLPVFIASVCGGTPESNLEAMRECGELLQKKYPELS